MVATLAAATPATDGIAPPIDQPIRYTLREERISNGVPLRFAARRQVSFHVTADGFEADIITLDATAEPRGRAATLYLAAMAPIGQRPLRARLDRQGHVLSIIDQEASWGAITAAIGASTSGGTVRSQNAEAITRQLNSLPFATVKSLLATTIEALLVNRGDLPAATGRRVLAVPISLPDGRRTTTSGVEEISVAPQIVTLVDTATMDQGDAHIDYRATRAVDRASGLLISQDERRDITIASRGTKATLNVHISITRNGPVL